MANKTLDKLAEITKESLWHLIGEVETREDAIAIRDMFSRPLGVLASKFALETKNKQKRFRSLPDKQKT